MSIATAITRLQELSALVSGMKFTPDTPPEASNAFPCSVAFINDGTVSVDDASTTRELYTIRVDLHYNRTNMRKAYADLNAAIPAYARLLAGDPTLSGAVDTIVFPVTCTVGSLLWNEQETLAASFLVPIKIRETPTAS